jgi:hypothetical protein
MKSNKYHSYWMQGKAPQPTRIELTFPALIKVFSSLFLKFLLMFSVKTCCDIPDSNCFMHKSHERNDKGITEAGAHSHSLWPYRLTNDLFISLRLYKATIISKTSCINLKANQFIQSIKI